MPLVDVVLVLLIIFMLTAHVMEFGLQVEVPKVKPAKENVQDLPVVSITKDGTSYLNDKPVNIHLLAEEIHKRYRNATSVYLSADYRTPFRSNRTSDRRTRRRQAGGQCGDTTAGQPAGKR